MATTYSHNPYESMQAYGGFTNQMRMPAAAAPWTTQFFNSMGQQPTQPMGQQPTQPKYGGLPNYSQPSDPWASYRYKSPLGGGRSNYQGINSLLQSGGQAGAVNPYQRAAFNNLMGNARGPQADYNASRAAATAFGARSPDELTRILNGIGEQSYMYSYNQSHPAPSTTTYSQPYYGGRPPEPATSYSGGGGGMNYGFDPYSGGGGGQIPLGGGGIQMGGGGLPMGGYYRPPGEPSVPGMETMPGVVPRPNNFAPQSMPYRGLPNMMGSAMRR